MTPDYTPISKKESQVGKYADIDSDGTVDGIVFADLAVGGSEIYNKYNIEDSFKNENYEFLYKNIIKSVKMNDIH